MAELSPFRETDDQARALARALLQEATFAALAVAPEGVPSVTRIAFALDPEGRALSLISTLSSHTAALEANPICALLVGEPAEKGDPLTHPRLTLHTEAEIIARSNAQHSDLRDHYLKQRPKAGLYIDFGDFRLVRFHMRDALLNGGFGKAYILKPKDLYPPHRVSG